MSEQEEIDQIAAVISAPAGCCVSLFGEIFIYQLEDGRFSLMEDGEDGEGAGTETIYKDARKAAEAFVSLRQKKKLGFDMEG